MQKINKFHIIIGIGLFLLCTSVMSGQVVIIDPANNAVKTDNHISVSVTGKPGISATLFVNNKEVGKGKIRIDGFFDFLNLEVPNGPISIVVETIGVGNRVFQAKREIHILGSPKKILPYADKVSLPADGITKKMLSFEVQDEWGYTHSNVKFASVSLTRGNIVNRDAHKDMAGVQIPIRNGLFEITIQAPIEAGSDILEIEINSEYLQFPVQFTTPIKPFIMVGTISGTVINQIAGKGSENHPYIEIIDESDVTNRDGVAYDGRTAFYASGSIADGYQLTASLDTDRDYYNQVYEDVNPDEPLSIYGDASVLTYDAQTKSQFFAKLDHNQSFIMYGDYNTSFNSTEFGASNRTLNGLYSKFTFANHSLLGFASYADQIIGNDQIRGDGTSGFYFLTETNIVWRSEKIRFEVRDKYHPEIVLKSIEQHRYQDYDINYVDGTLMFKQPVLSIDESGNPRYILVFYEYQSMKKNAIIGGLRYDGSVMKKIKIGSTLLMEEQGLNDYQLVGADAIIPINNWIAAKGEYAVSKNPELSGTVSTGNAYKTEIHFTPQNNIDLNAYYRTVDSSFVNRSQSNAQNEIGSTKYGFKGSYNPKQWGSITTEYYYQGNKLGSENESKVNVLNLFYNKKITAKSFLKVGYEDSKLDKKQPGSDNRNISSSKLLRYTASYQFTEKLIGLLDHDQNLSSDSQSKPTSSAIGISYDITKKLRTYVKYRHVYNTGSPNQTVFGFDSKVRENTEITGKYEMGGAIGEQRNRASIGLRNQWVVRDNLTLNLAFENTSTIDSLEVSTPEHTSGSVSFEYFPDIPVKITGKQEYRIDKVTKKWVTTFGADFKLFNSFSAIIKLNNQFTDYINQGAGETRHSSNSIGLAFRPEKSDIFNGFAKIAFVSDENSHVDPIIKLDRMILSLHGYWQPMKKLEFGGRVAHRNIQDVEGDLFSDITTTIFYSLRTEYELSLKWGLALDTRFIQMHPVNEYKIGSAIELDYVIFKNAQLGLGYTLKRYNDPDFSYMNSDISSVYVTVNLKLSEQIFE